MKATIFAAAIAAGLYPAFELTRYIIDYMNKNAFDWHLVLELVIMWSAYLIMLAVIKLGLRRI